jgi:hypothetical protein
MKKYRYKLLVPASIVIVVIFAILYILGGMGPLNNGQEFDTLGLTITLCVIGIILLVVYFIGLLIDISNQHK